jgi:hypothetical protein
MSEIDKFLKGGDGPADDSIDSFLGPAPTPAPSGVLRRAVGDPLTSIARGVVAVPQAAVGIADLVTSGQAGKVAEELGFRPEEAKKIIGDTLYSPEAKAAQQAVDSADGFLPTLGAIAENPSVIVNKAAESIPSMLAGGVVGRGAAALGVSRATAGAVGEGVVAAGQGAEQIRSETPDGLLTGTQAAIAAGSGLLPGAIHRASGGLADKYGLGDPDRLFLGAGGKPGPIGMLAGNTPAKILARMAAGGFTEGALEELPQSMQEHIAQNVALGKPWDEGLGNAAAQGLAVGTAMGAAIGPFSTGGQQPPPPAPPGAPGAPPPQAGMVPGGAPGGPGGAGGPPVYTVPPGLPPPNALGKPGAGQQQLGTNGQDPNVIDVEARVIDPQGGPIQRAAAIALGHHPDAGPVVAVGAPNPPEETEDGKGETKDVSRETAEPGLSEDDLSTMFDEAAAEVAAEKTDTPAPPPPTVIADDHLEGAHQAATSPLNTRPEPTEAQKAAENYKVGKIRMQGMTLSVENPQGSERKWTAPDGRTGSTSMQDHYTRMPGTRGADTTPQKRQHLDAFVKVGTPKAHDGPIFVVDQVDPKTGKFDEHKVIFGATDEADARATYERNYETGWRGTGSVTRMDPKAFKKWAYDGTIKTQPAGDLKLWGAAAAAPVPGAAPAAAAPVAQPPASPAPVAAPGPAASGPAPVAAPGAAISLRLGSTPTNAEPVTIDTDGTVLIGKYAALDFNSGEPVVVRPGASVDEVKAALRAAEVIGKNQKFFGGGKAAEAPVAPQKEPESSDKPGSVQESTDKPAPTPVPTAAPIAAPAQPEKGEPVQTLKLPDPKRPNAVPFAELKLVKFSDGKFGVGHGWQLSKEGEGTPTGMSPHFDTREEALSHGADKIRAKVTTRKDLGPGDGKLVEQIKAWLDKVSPPPAAKAPAPEPEKVTSPAPPPAESPVAAPAPSAAPAVESGELVLPAREQGYRVGPQWGAVKLAGREWKVTAVNDAGTEATVETVDKGPARTAQARISQVLSSPLKGEERDFYMAIGALAEELGMRMVQIAGHGNWGYGWQLKGDGWDVELNRGSKHEGGRHVDAILVKSWKPNYLNEFVSTIDAARELVQRIAGTQAEGVQSTMEADKAALLEQFPVGAIVRIKAWKRIGAENGRFAGRTGVVTKGHFDGWYVTLHKTIREKSDKEILVSKSDGMEALAEAPPEPKTQEQVKAERREREREVYRDLTTSSAMEGKGVPEIVAELRTRLEGLELTDAKLEQLAKAIHKEVGATAAEREKAKHRDPKVLEETLGWATRTAIPTIIDRTPEREAAVKAGFMHAMAGKTKSTLTGDNLADMQKGYAAAVAWRETEEGAAWFEGRPVNKLENTGLDLRRHWELMKAQMKANENDVDRAWAQIERATARADLFAPLLPEGTAPGLVVYVKALRDGVMPFKKWLTNRYSRFAGDYVGRRESEIPKILDGSRYPRALEDQAQKWEDDPAFRANWLREAADTYLGHVRELLSTFEGKTTVADAADAFEAKYIDAAALAKEPETRNDRYMPSTVLNEAGRKLTTSSGAPGLWDGYSRELIQLRRKSDFTMEAEKTTSLQDNNVAKQLVPPRLDHVTRSGLTDLRVGENVTPADFKATFGLADVGFGKWVGAKQDQDHLNYSYDALFDLARHVGIAPKAVGFGGALHFTIGALGHGKFAAHFHPAHPGPEGSVQVINVTNTKGDGTVAHEWTHALDHNLGGDWRGGVRNRFLTMLRHTIATPAYVEEVARRFLLGGSYWKGDKTMKKAESARRGLKWYVGSSMPSTAYNTNAMQLGADYWGNDEEMIARAFEAWFGDTLGGTNSYLVNTAWSGDGATTKDKGYRGTPYPTGTERATINKVIGALVKSIKWDNGRPSVTLADFEAAIPEELKAGEKRRAELLKPDAMEAFHEELVSREADKQAQRASEAEDKRRAEQEELDRMAQEKLAELQPPVVDTPPPSAAMGALSEGDIGAIFDEAAAELREASAEKPAELPPPDLSEEAAPPPAAENASKQGGGDRGETPAAGQVANAAAKLVAEAARLGVKGAGEALTGLAKLFSGQHPDPNVKKLMTFPGGSVDEHTYELAKPHFKAALEAFRASGKTLKDLFKLLIQQLGDGIKPYAIRFAKEEGLTASLGQQAPAAALSPSAMLAKMIDADLRIGRKIEWQRLFTMADGAFGGTQAEGKYTPKDAYDALELGINMHVLAAGAAYSPIADAPAAASTVRSLERLLTLIPTQSKRTGEQNDFQQFSTVPTFAYVANWVGNPSAADVMLEPSAGIGGLAVFSKVAGAKLVLNELSARRAQVLRELFPDSRVWTENAEQLDNILPADVVPSLVVMNPPFSNSASRGVKKDTMIGAEHVEQALLRLADGGRLVAIVGTGMARDKATFKAWWAKIDAKYDVRAAIPVDGAGYAKYGTTFDNALLVIDKVPPSGRAVVTTSAAAYTDLLPLLEGIRNDRPQSQRPAGDGASSQPAAAESAPAGPVQEGEGNAGVGLSGDGGAGVLGEGEPGRPGPGVAADAGGKPGPAAGKGRGRSPRVPAGAGAAASDDAQGSGRGADAASDGLTGVTLEAAAPAASTTAIGDSIFEGYTPQRLKIAGAKPHPGALVQSAAMATVLPPAPTYTPNLPAKTITEGLLSIAQLESVVYAGQAHAEFLEETSVKDPKTRADKMVKPRRGFFIGDGTGVGKGREIGGIMLDNLRQGRKRHVWVSEKQGLMHDAKRDFGGVGGDPSILFNQNATEAEGSIDAKKTGILFTTYSTLRSGAQSQATNKPATAPKLLKDFPAGTTMTVETPGGTNNGYGVVRFDTKNQLVVAKYQGYGREYKLPFDDVVSIDGIRDWKQGRPESKSTKKAAQSRLDQLVAWLGPDFDGVIAFDEAHNAGNALAIKGERGTKDPSQQAMAVVDLQNRLPNARIVYVSATGATQVANLSFANRLGMWGPGTPFPTAEGFIAQMNAGGLATMELIARDMKQMGVYLARSLSYDGVTYSRVEHELTPNQRAIYNRLAEAWQVVLKNMTAALELTGAAKNGRAKGAARSAFWGAQQRFFNQVITSMQMPSVVEQMERDLEAGHAIVAQLVNTNEAQQERSLAKLKDDEAELEELDMTPRDQLLQMVEKAFPVTQYEEYVDENGKKQTRPVLDAGGNPVQNRQAVAMRDKLLQDLKDIKVPDGPLEVLLNHFGPEVMAEVTGRGQRVVAGRWNRDPKMGGKPYVEKRGASSNKADADAFQGDKKRILVFSDAGGTGFSFHADLTKPNQRKRMHYLLQPGWRADKAVQGLGRSHRTNQASPPHNYLASTDIPAQKRFLSAIARRLDQLGALTKGQRDTANQGMFSEKDNLESVYATRAVRQLLQDTQKGKLDGLDFNELMTQLGLDDLVDPMTGSIPEEKYPPTQQFLNRMLSLTLEMQGKVFDAFLAIMEEQVNVAMQTGELDTGMQTIRALSSTIVREEKVYEDPKTGAETIYVELSLTHPSVIHSFPTAEAEKRKVVYVRNAKSGKVSGLVQGGQTTLKDGSVVDRVSQRTTTGTNYKVAPDFRDRAAWPIIPIEEARALWEAENAQRPQTYTTTAHMVTGALLPIWDRINADGFRPKVARTQTNDGRRLLGLVIDKLSINDVLKRLNVQSPVAKLSAAELLAEVLKGKVVELANGWKLGRSKVSNDLRVELHPGYLSNPAHRQLEADGVIYESIGFKARYFIPTGAKGAEVLGKMLKSKPAIDMQDPNAAKDDEAPQFRAGPAPAQGMSAADVLAKINRIMRGWFRRPEVKVLDSMAEAPERVQQEWAKHVDGGANGVAKAFHWKGTIYLVAGNLADEAEIRTAVWHETLGHFGLRGVFGGIFNDILDGLAVMHHAAVAAKATEYGLDMENLEDRRMAAEEVLAELAQSRPELGWVRRAVAAVKTWLRQHGLLSGPMSADEILAQYIIPARNWVERGAADRTTAPSGRTQPAFGVSPLRADSPTDKLAAMGYRVEQGYEDEPAWIEHVADGTMYDWNEDTSRFEDEEGNPLPQAAAELAQYIGNAIEGIEHPDNLHGAANDFNSDPFNPTAGRQRDEDDDAPQFMRQAARTLTPDQEQAMRNVGIIRDPVGWRQRLADLRKDLGKKLVQGIVDQFAPIKELSTEAYGLLRLAKGASGAFETLLRGGLLKIVDNAYDFDTTKRGGFVDRIIKPLQGEHFDFMSWVAANRAEALKAQNRERLFTDQDIAHLKTLDQGTLNFDYTLQTGPRAGQVTRARAEAYADALKVFNEFNKNVLDMAEQSGLIDGAGRALWESDFYVPFYREMEDGTSRGMNIKDGVIRQRAFKRLKGGEQQLHDLLENTLQNWAHLIDASAKNRAALATLNVLEATGNAVQANAATVRQLQSSLSKKDGAVWVMDGGVQKWYFIDDPMMLAAVSALEFSGLRSPIMHALGNFKHWLTIGVTASPFFKVRNLIRDSLQAPATASGMGYNPFANIMEGWKYTERGSDDYFTMLSSGAAIHFGSTYQEDEARRMERIIRAGIPAANVLNTPDKLRVFWDRYGQPAIDAYSELGERGETVNRATLYKQLRSQGKNHAEASMLARDLMDFSLQGTFTTVRFLSQVVPFFNARLQGMYKLGRAAVEDPARFATVLGATALFTVALAAAYGGDDDWKKREDWDRNNYWWFKVGGVAFRIPKPFEVGAIATLAERSFEYVTEKEMTGKRFRDNVLHLLSDQLALNPIPQLAKPIIDVYANKDSFTGRPIEKYGMEHLQAKYRYTERTSLTARATSTALNAVTGVVGADAVSPVQVDHLIRGYFGWLGSFVVGAADMLARPLTGQPERADPDYWKVATGSIVSTLEGAPSRYVSAMYDEAKRLEQVYGTWRQLLQQGNLDEAAAFRASRAEEFARYPLVEGVKRSQNAIFRQERRVELEPLTGEQKRQRILELERQRDALARRLSPQ